MRFGITAKLFLAIFSTCILVLITMHWGVRMSFERGFVDYIKQGNAPRVEQSRRAFMADISHKLRTPLAVLSGELEAIQDGVRKADSGSLLSLQNEVSTLTKLVDDLHQLSLSDVGALAYRRVSVDLIQLLHISVGSFNERFQKKHIEVITQLPERARAFGDPDRLSQLFNNLLENSLRYTDNGGQLQIRDILKMAGALWYGRTARRVSTPSNWLGFSIVSTAQNGHAIAPAAVKGWDWLSARISLRPRGTIVC